jgi:hypothetical protein
MELTLLENGSWKLGADSVERPACASPRAPLRAMEPTLPEAGSGKLATRGRPLHRRVREALWMPSPDCSHAVEMPWRASAVGMGGSPGWQNRRVDEICWSCTRVMHLPEPYCRQSCAGAASLGHVWFAAMLPQIVQDSAAQQCILLRCVSCVRLICWRAHECR